MGGPSWCRWVKCLRRYSYNSPGAGGIRVPEDSSAWYRPSGGRSASADLPLYSDFLDLISDRERYEVHPVAEYDSAYVPDKINILLRHDVDYSNGFDMAKMDYDMGFRSTSYLRVFSSQIPSAPPQYEIDQVASTWQWFARHDRMEIGYHYDVMDETTMGFSRPTDMDQARVMFGQDLEHLRKYFEIRTVSAHGGSYNYLYESGDYTRTKNLEPYGVVSASYLPFTAFPSQNYFYLSDLEGQVDYLKGKLLDREAGDVVQVLIHPFARRWSISGYLAPSSLEDPLSGGQATNSSSSTGGKASMPAPTGGRRNLVPTPQSSSIVPNPSTVTGLNYRLGLLALAPLALLLLAVWRHDRLQSAEEPHSKR
jgi:hypothetical protein